MALKLGGKDKTMNCKVPQTEVDLMVICKTGNGEITYPREPVAEATIRYRRYAGQENRADISSSKQVHVRK